ncbi:MAG TPA: hypothetical protein VFE47_27755 [Tepidisphaeraceae bacterium]|nr:hypothetical protein [Tepidisphaeraceae bacterium]
MVDVLPAILDSFPLNPPPLPFAHEVAFADYNNKYAGKGCYIVGRGPTGFDYARLADVTDPVFFINDAVCLEKHVSSETFFFAHDARMRIWLNGSIRATAVLPIDGKIFVDSPGDVLKHRDNVVFYYWREMDRRALLTATRDEVARLKILYLHSGTIHPLIHFIWFCGFKRVRLIGCDGINSSEILTSQCGAPDGYDARLTNMSLTCPLWHYDSIRRTQDLLISLFGLEATYIGTPGSE